MMVSVGHSVAHPARRAPRTGSSRRRWLLCAVALVLLLAHQALAARDHHGPTDRTAAQGPSAGTALAAPDAAPPPAAPPDVATGPDAPDAPATLRGACPAHQGTLPPLSGGDPPLVAAPAAVLAAASLRMWPSPPRADDPRRRRALLQVFRN